MDGYSVVEQYRLLHGMLQVIQEVNAVTGLPICNENTCPTMSAGRYVVHCGETKYGIGELMRLS